MGRTLVLIHSKNAASCHSYQEDITIINIYTPNKGPPKYYKSNINRYTDIKGETDSDIIIVGDFNTPLTPMDRSSGQKINKETVVLNDTLDQMGLPDIYIEHSI